MATCGAGKGGWKGAAAALSQAQQCLRQTLNYSDSSQQQKKYISSVFLNEKWHSFRSARRSAQSRF